MERHDLYLQIENMKALIDIERENFSEAITTKNDMTLLLKMRENLATLARDLRMMEEKFRRA